MFMTGCVKDNHSSNTKGDDWGNVSMPVPIEFSLANQDVKSMISSTDDLIDLPFGVFALDNNKNLGMKESVYLDNVSATCDKPDNSVRFKLEGNYFYPKESVSFDFYGYHPKVKDVRFNDANTVLYVRVPVGDTTDVLYAKAYATDADGNSVHGFNADYIRNGGAKPMFTFSHVTAGLSFRVQNNTSRTLAVNYLYFKDFYTKAVLCLAGDAESEGCLIPGNGSVAMPYYLGNNDKLNVLVGKEQDKPLYPMIFAMPQDYYNCRLSVNGVMYNFILRPEDLQPGSGGHKAGYVYRYLFVVETIDGQITVRLEKDI